MTSRFQAYPFSRLAPMRVIVVPVALVALALGSGPLIMGRAGAAAQPPRLDCVHGLLVSVAPANPEALFGEGVYVGHDEPAVLFYSNRPGSGNRAQYQLTLPTEPPTQPTQDGTGGTFTFQLQRTFWFGMALCATQSFPEQVSTCTPDSDSNIVDPAVSPNHPGMAFMELSFYPPGWVQAPFGISCDPTRWCAALGINSAAEDPVTGTTLNPTCAAQIIGGLEYANFAFVTRDGRAQAPANPIQATLATFTPDPTRDLFMNAGDRLVVSMHDTGHGLRVEIHDLTTQQSGFMTASAENGFGQVKYAPAPSTECTNLPYDFHPMYSTSSPQTRVLWAAHSANISFSGEIGHWDYCSAVPAPFANCAGVEGAAGDQEPADGDDTVCLPAPTPPSVPVAGCFGANAAPNAFDGTSYQPLWPDGDTVHHPSPVLFSSPLTGEDYSVNYSRVAFENILPLDESFEAVGTCDVVSGAGCTLIPTTDDNEPAAFYPFYTTARVDQRCVWALGNAIPGVTTNDFGRNNEYGQLLPLAYPFGPGGSAVQLLFNFRQILPANPCLARPGEGG